MYGLFLKPVVMSCRVLPCASSNDIIMNTIGDGAVWPQPGKQSASSATSQTVDKMLP